MKKQILAAASFILLVVNLAHAETCSPDKVAGVWVMNNNVALPDLKTCGKVKYQERFQVHLFSVDNELSGHAFSNALTTFTRCPGVNSTIEFPNIQMAEGRFYVTDDRGDVRDSECVISADGQRLNMGQAVFERIGDAATATRKSTAAELKEKQNRENLADWAPAPQTPEAVKTYPKPVQQTQPQHNSNLGDWAPVSQ